MTTKSRLEDLIEDVDVFRLMLEGAFREWGGTFDVYLPDTNKYLFGAKHTIPGFNPYCLEIRSVLDGDGDRRCFESDRHAANRMKQTRRLDVYPCHAGLRDIAIPIEVNDELIGVILCGQVRWIDDERDQQSLAKTHQLEDEFKIPKGKLVALWEKIPRVEDRKINETINRVTKIVQYVVGMGSQRRELQLAHAKDQQRQRESREIQLAAQSLNKLSTSWDMLWEKTEQVLMSVIQLIGASSALILEPGEPTNDDNPVLHVPVLTGLPAHTFDGVKIPLDTPLYYGIEDVSQIKRMPFPQCKDNDVICRTISQKASELAQQFDEVVLIKLNFEQQHHGLLILFINQLIDKQCSLSIIEEQGLLLQLAFLVGAAHANCSQYLNDQRALAIRRVFLRNITHQLIAPLHGLMGNADLAQRRLQKWLKDGEAEFERDRPGSLHIWKSELLKWEHTFDALVATASHAARLAHNLEWNVYSERVVPTLTVIADMPGLLIEVARDFQGVARERGIPRLEVEPEGTRFMNNRIRVDRSLFRQALGNLLDNATKYSDKNTTITVKAESLGSSARIHVINYGIRLYPQQATLIFKDGERTDEAKRRFPAGTGIGLTVARDIINKFGGGLAAAPSEYTEYGWMTTFTITLPLLTS